MVVRRFDKVALILWEFGFAVASFARCNVLHITKSRSIEGMMSSSARFIAMMDADLQHDETVLAAMLTRLRAESLDVVVGARNASGGSMGQFSRGRVAKPRGAGAGR